MFFTNQFHLIFAFKIQPSIAHFTSQDMHQHDMYDALTGVRILSCMKGGPTKIKNNIFLFLDLKVSFVRRYISLYFFGVVIKVGIF